MRAPLLLLAPLALLACSAEPEVPGTPFPEQAPTRAASALQPSAGEGPPILLAALTAADREAHPLEGELGCSFETGEGALLVAFGDVADDTGYAQALAKVGEEVERLTAREAGGFDGLPGGAVFTSPSMTLTISRTSDTPLSGGESPSYPAELLLRRTAGAEQTIPGRWTCGP